jgi:uncharacterized delta-60 repeat protein
MGGQGGASGGQGGGGQGGAGGTGGVSDPLVFAGGTGVNGISNLYGLTYAAVGAHAGKLYASGVLGGNVVLLRLDADGSVDETFGDGGVAESGVSGVTYGVVELENGDLIVQGNGGGETFLVKFDSAGELDVTFGRVVVFGWDPTDRDAIGDACSAAAADPAEDALVEACTDLWPAATAPEFAERPSYTSWGIQRDTSGAVEKVVVFAFGSPAKASAGTQRADNDRWIARVLASDGAHDPDFNGGAPFTIDVADLAGPDNARRGLVEPDGAIVSGGYTDWGSGNNVVLIRLNGSGTLDSDFGFDTVADPSTLQPGMTRFNPFTGPGTPMAEAYAVLRQGPGRYVTTGYGWSNHEVSTVENDLVSFRVLPTGVDTTWGQDGSVAIQSETDQSAIDSGTWTVSESTHGASSDGRVHRENGRDLTLLPGGATFHVGCYNDYASVHVLDEDGAPLESFGDRGMIVFDKSHDVTHTAPFFAVARSREGRIATTAQGDFLAIFDLGDD